MNSAKLSRFLRYRSRYPLNKEFFRSNEVTSPFGSDRVDGTRTTDIAHQWFPIFEHVFLSVYRKWFIPVVMIAVCGEYYITTFVIVMCEMQLLAVSEVNLDQVRRLVEALGVLATLIFGL